MNKLVLLLSLCVAGFFSYAQEQALFPVDNLLKGSERPQQGPVYYTAESGKQLPDSLIAACISELNTDSINSYLQSLENFGTRFLLAENRHEVANWIKDKFIALGYPDAYLDSFECVVQWPPNTGPLDTTWQYNVFATLTGQDNPAVEVIIGGHYDAIIYSGGDPYITAPGADDNGSSVAATLEIARVLKEKNINPSSSLVFAAWAGEERGLLGSTDKVIKALTNGEHVKTYINMDMIANEPDTANWRFNINMYTGSEWLGTIAHDVALSYTSLIPDAGITNSIGSDSYVFYLGGFSPVYFSEDHFSLNYHHITDLVVNCNMPYCTEITKVALGTLLTADLVPSKVNFELLNPGTGNSLIASWPDNPETNLAGYKVRVGYSSGSYHQTFTTPSSIFFLNNLSPDTVYYVSVCAVGSNGYEGPAMENFDRPALVTMDQGILIVDDSEGGVLNPQDTTVDNFYKSLVQSFQYSEYDAYQAQDISLGELGKYSSVLWHINKQTSITVLNRYLKEVINYLKLGGNILFSIYQPEKAIYKISSYPNQWPEGTFFNDFLGIGYNELNPVSLFNEAVLEYPEFIGMSTDPNKTVAANNHHLTYIEGLWPHNNGSIIYRYGTDYDTSTLQGDMYGVPVGIRSQGISPYDWKTVTLSFPLYYMEYQSAKVFTEFIMMEVFGELPIGIDEPEANTSVLSIIPNPATNKAELLFSLPKPSIVIFSVYNALGDKVRTLDKQLYTSGSHSRKLDLSGLPTGLYFIKMQAGDNIVSRKLVIIKP
ncbi:MAG: M20/M25/M40 family metallo-hydrolase [Bacteroidales bacterium]